MNRSVYPATEPIHLQALRGFTCVGLAMLLAGPMSGTPGLVAAVLAALAAVAAAPRLARSPVRLPVVAIACISIVATGALSESLVGGFEFPARWFGLPTALGAIEVLRVGLTLFGGMLLLRTTALRYPAIAVLELFLAVAAAARLLLAHRDLQIGRPFFLADRAFERNVEPDAVLAAVGVATVAGAFFLMLPKRRARHTLAGLLAAAVLLLGGFSLLRFYKPENNPFTPPGGEGESKLGMNEKPSNGGSGSSNGGKDRELDFNPPPPNPQQNRPVAVVNLHDDATPVGTAWYLRQVVYSRFNGVKLVRATKEGDDGDVPAQFPTGPITIPGFPAPPKGTAVVRSTVHLMADQTRPFGLVNPTSMEPAPNPNTEQFRRSYSVVSWIPIHPKLSGTKPTHLFAWLLDKPVGDPSWDAARKAAHLAFPADPRYGELVQKILAEAVAAGKLPKNYKDKPVLMAVVIREWVEKNTIYSLKPQGLSETDPVGDFLFVKRKGYCVHIAHATAFLMRAAGIPSRVAGGYAVKVTDVGTRSSLIVRGSDGHAWPEIYVTGYGWVVLDPAPTAEPGTPQPGPMDSRTAQRLDEMSRPDPVPKPEESPAENAETPPAPQRYLAVWLLLAVLASLYGIKAWRRIAPHFGSASRQHRFAYRAVLDRLAEVGMVRHFGETREAFAQRLADKLPTFQTLTEAHVRKAILKGETDKSAWDALRRSAAAEVDRTYSRCRRVLGVLHPLSWLVVR